MRFSIRIENAQEYHTLMDMLQEHTTLVWIGGHKKPTLLPDSEYQSLVRTWEDGSEVFIYATGRFEYQPYTELTYSRGGYPETNSEHTLPFSKGILNHDYFLDFLKEV